AESFPLAKGGSLSAAQFLELFLFSPEKQYTYLSSLSGGDKKRLQLLTILFRNPNFLILDEPTNDLDLPTLSVLENFLTDFPGCVLIVSHDRYFMDKLVDHLFVFEGNGVIKDFPGNYTQYRLEEKIVDSIQMGDDRKKVVDSVNSQPSTANRKLSYKEKREFEQLEKEIADLEAEKQNIEEQLSNPTAPFEQLNLLSHRINVISNELNQKEMRWLELSEFA
ncbi:MAG: ATP-binding cassette domain-containing protein, partial [Parafilimonas sp.]|nr:ATP-binding cassette domain-containing protein [Parafilimonas sp.]